MGVPRELCLTSFLFLLLRCAEALRVHPSDALPRAELADAPYPANSPIFNVTGPLAVAASCPCLWSLDDELRMNLQGRILVVPTGVCAQFSFLSGGSGMDRCAFGDIQCWGYRTNASGVVIACDFARDVDSEALAPSDCIPEGAESRCGRKGGGPPAAVVLNNVSGLLEGLACANVSAIIAARAAAAAAAAAAEENAAAGGSVAGNATGNATVPRPPPVAWVWPGGGEYNVTLDWVGTDDCAIYRNVPPIYLVVVPVWWILTVLWTWNTYRRNAASARDLHRLLCWVPIIQFVNGVLSLFYFSSCPWEGTIELVYAMFWAVVTILKEPLILLCLLLVAKGWCITRNHLTRREVCLAGTTVALLYAAISIQLSMASVMSLVPMVAMYLAMLADIVSSIWSNLRILKAQLLVLRSFGIDPATTPVARKYVMFVRLAKFTALYTLFEVVVHAAFPRQADGTYWLFILLHSLMEIAVAVGIGYTFRAQPLNVHFQQVQQVAAELAEQMLPSITTVEVKPESMAGANLIAWRPEMDLSAMQARLPSTLLVLNPGDIEVFPPLVGASPGAVSPVECIQPDGSAPTAVSGAQRFGNRILPARCSAGRAAGGPSGAGAAGGARAARPPPARGESDCCANPEDVAREALPGDESLHELRAVGSCTDPPL